MNKYLFSVLAYLICSNVGLAREAVPLASLFPHLGSNSAVFAIAPSTLAVVGPITTGVLDGVLRHTKVNPIDTIFVDSAGGEVESSIKLALFMRERNMRLVVAGRCLSACANFLFVAARKKDVLPGSLIGIHETRYLYHGKNHVIEVSERDRNSLVQLSGDALATAKITAASELEKRFYADFGLSERYFQSFRQYESAREAAASIGRRACPAFSFWALNRNDLTRIGIKGVDAAWFPSSLAEARETAVKLGLDAKSVFFGTEQELAGLCQTKKSLTERVRSFFELR